MTFEVYFEIIRILLLNCDAMSVVSFSGKQCRWANVKDNGSFRQHTQRPVYRSEYIAYKCKHTFKGHRLYWNPEIVLWGVSETVLSAFE